MIPPSPFPSPLNESPPIVFSPVIPIAPSSKHVTMTMSATSSNTNSFIESQQRTCGTTQYVHTLPNSSNSVASDSVYERRAQDKPSATTESLNIKESITNCMTPPADPSPIVHSELTKFLVYPQDDDSYMDAPQVPGQPTSGAKPPSNIQYISSVAITMYDVQAAMERRMKEQSVITAAGGGMSGYQEYNAMQTAHHTTMGYPALATPSHGKYHIDIMFVCKTCTSLYNLPTLNYNYTPCLYILSNESFNFGSPADSQHISASSMPSHCYPFNHNDPQQPTVSSQFDPFGIATNHHGSNPTAGCSSGPPIQQHPFTAATGGEPTNVLPHHYIGKPPPSHLSHPGIQHPPIDHMSAHDQQVAAAIHCGTVTGNRQHGLQQLQPGAGGSSMQHTTGPVHNHGINHSSNVSMQQQQQAAGLTPAMQQYQHPHPLPGPGPVPPHHPHAVMQQHPQPATGPYQQQLPNNHSRMHQVVGGPVGHSVHPTASLGPRTVPGQQYQQLQPQRHQGSHYHSMMTQHIDADHGYHPVPPPRLSHQPSIGSGNPPLPTPNHYLLNINDEISYEGADNAAVHRLLAMS